MLIEDIDVGYVTFSFCKEMNVKELRALKAIAMCELSCIKINEGSSNNHRAIHKRKNCLIRGVGIINALINDKEPDKAELEEKIKNLSDNYIKMEKKLRKLKRVIDTLQLIFVKFKTDKEYYRVGIEIKAAINRAIQVINN